MTIKTHTFDNGYTVEIQKGAYHKYGFTYEYRVLISAGGYMCETHYYPCTADMLEACWNIMKRDQHCPDPMLN